MAKPTNLSSLLKGARKLPKLCPELLLHPNIPKPMHGVAPRVVLGQAWWDKERAAAAKRAGWRCQACGIHKKDTKQRRLEGHEVYAIDYPRGRMTYVEAVVLCHACHAFIHSGRLEMQVRAGQMPKEEAERIIAHGNAVLRRAWFKAKVVTGNGRCAAWSKWRLVVNGKLFAPKFKSFKAWTKYWKKGAQRA